jgi:hypothetical protein
MPSVVALDNTEWALVEDLFDRPGREGRPARYSRRELGETGPGRPWKDKRLMEPRRYSKPGTSLVLHSDRLELSTGLLRPSETHSIPFRTITGVFVEGALGHRLRIEAAGRTYRVDAGIGAAATLRRSILDAIRREFIEQAEEDTRRRLGRGLTAEELEWASQQFPDDVR